MSTAHRIVVGVDDYPNSLVAVDLAMQEGALRRRPVHLVHADPWANHPAWRDQRADPEVELLSPPEVAIRSALRRVGDGTDTPVTSEIAAGSPSRVLLEQARNASMVIVGDRGGGGFVALNLGSVALQLAAHAPCPVLVARGHGDPRNPVVVGADGSAASAAALEFAFIEAELREVDLVALHSWVDPLIAELVEVILPDHHPDRLDAEQRELLSDSLRPGRAAHPTVKVHERIVRGRASNALVEASQQAQLVVVGARGGGGFPGLKLGSVTHALLHHSGCPVAVVRHAEAAGQD